ncbi:MAG: hydroxymethylglutaryl-CoA lyase [Methylorubrum populi]
MPEAGRVEIYEVGPRDGLQNEARAISTQDKVRLVDLLSACGFRHVEAASFVSPRWVPQMADGADVLDRIRRPAGTIYAALTPNLRGYEHARAARAGEVAIFASASEGFSRRNINCSVTESMERFHPIVVAAAKDGIPVRGYVSCVVACPYDGPTEPTQVALVTERLLELGCREVSLGDTIGAGTAETVAAMLRAVRSAAPVDRLAGHFHDTGGRALECVAAALEEGVRVFDASVAGAGGCPYAPGSAGNVATGRVLDFVEAGGFATGIDRVRLAEAEAFMTQLLGRST